MPRNRAKEKAFPVGLFILFSLALIVGGILWLRSYTLRPNYFFIVEYSEPGHVAPGAAVYYRGVPVGRVTKTELAPDFQSTYMHIGITQDPLPLPDNVQVHIRIEGITGQRFLEIEPPEIAVGRIQNGELVQGVENFTLQKFQEQLARIVEERAIEKLLASSEEAMSELSRASRQWQLLSQRAGQWLQVTQDPARQALVQLDRTARQIETATTDFQGLTHQARGDLANALPRIAQAAETFGQSGRSIDAAMVEVQQAAGEVRQTFSTVQTNLLPSASQTLTELGAGLQSFDQVLQGAGPVASDLQSLLSALGATGEQLEESLGLLQPDQTAEGEALAGNLQEIRELGATIRETVRTVRTGLSHTQDPQEVQRQLRALEQLSRRITEVTERVSPGLAQKQKSDSIQGQPALRPLQSIATAIQDLGRLSQLISFTIRRIEPMLASVALTPPPQRPISSRGPGLIGTLQTTLLNMGMASRRIDCVSSQLSQILGQRFLFFKLLFGKPGAGYEACADPLNCLVTMQNACLNDPASWVKPPSVPPLVPVSRKNSHGSVAKNSQ